MTKYLRKIAIVAASIGIMLSASFTAGAQDKKPRIAFIPGIASDPFFKAMEVGARQSAEELGLELLWQGSSVDYSPQEQIPFVDAALANDIDALILVPTDSQSLQASVTKAQAQNIPVITVDTTVDDQSWLVSHITGDNIDGGRMAAKTLAEQIGGKGEVFVISTSASNTTNRLRRQGFDEELAANYPEITIVDNQYHQSQPARATTITNTALLNYPDLKGIFAVDGTGTLGAVAGLRSAGRAGDVKLVGYDAYRAEVDALEDGVITALVAQRPGEEAALALLYAKMVITGNNDAKIEKNVVIPNIVLTKDNLEQNRHFIYTE